MNKELIAIEAGFEFWKDKGNGNIRIFSDSLEAIHVLRSDQDHYGIEEDCILRTKELLNNPLVKGIYYCPRANNVMAHIAARETSKSPHPRAVMDLVK